MSSTCPDCQSPLVFSANGRLRICESCGYKQKLEIDSKPLPSPEQILRDRRYREQHVVEAIDDERNRMMRSRDLLTRGVAAIKVDEHREAHRHFSKLIRQGSTEAIEVKAWLWLSQTYTDPDDKRACLEQVIAVKPTNAAARRGLALLDGRLSQEEIINPDKLVQEIPTEAQEAEAEQFRCPRCAGRMNYTPDGKTLRCDFCGHEDDPEAGNTQPHQPEYGIGVMEQDFIAALATAKGHLQPVATRILQCQSCAVEFTLAPETLSITCPYCDSVYVTETAETHEIMPPHALIPFATSEGQIRRVLGRWFKKHEIERPRVSPIVGVYLPLWTFDIGGEAKWRGKEKKGEQWVNINGSRHLFWDDVLVAGGKRPSKQLTRAFTDFDMTGLVEYDSRYLADWPAERYQLPLADASIQARKQVRRELMQNPSKLLRGRFVNDLTISTGDLSIDSFKLILLPLWMVHYKTDEEVYDVIINGQTKAIRGDRQQNIVGKLFSWLKGG